MNDDELRGALRSVLDVSAPAPTTSLDDVLRRGRRRVFLRWMGAVACVVVVAAGFGAGVIALANAPKTLPPAQTTTTSTTPTSVRPQANWPRIDTPTRTPTATISLSGVPPLGCPQVGTPELAGWPGSSKAPTTVLIAWEKALAGLAGTSELRTTLPDDPGERESHAYAADVNGHGSIWLRVGSFTGNPRDYADDQMWGMSDCVPPRRVTLPNGTVMQLHVVSEGMPMPTLYQRVRIYTPEGAIYEIGLSNHRVQDHPDMVENGPTELPLTEQQLADIALVVAEAA